MYTIRYLRWFLLNFRRRSVTKTIIFCFCIIWFFYLFIKIIFETKHLNRTTTTETIDLLRNKRRTVSSRFYNDTEYKKHLFARKFKKLEQLVKTSRILSFIGDKSISFPFENVHTFYYAWYGNQKVDQTYLHWNHNYIPSWKRNGGVVKKNHQAPLDIGSNYYPSLGCYSSRDPKIIDTHFRQVKLAGIGVVVISWAPPGTKDSPHDILPVIFHYANEHKIKITLHIEPYINRNPENLRKHLITFFNQYLNNSALYKINNLPLIYIYDSYLTPFTQWKDLLNKSGLLSIRNTKYDAIFIGLLVDVQHRYHIKKSNFDGFYTYFASNGFSYGSTWKNWQNLAKFAKQNQLIFIPSVAPGYVDTQVRQWNAVNIRHRRHGQYYDVAWRSAISSGANYISITSFNEWHEGTQIEPAQTKSIPEFTYLDYSPESPDFYLNLTKWWVDQFYFARKQKAKISLK